MAGPKLTFITITKDDPAGVGRTLASTAAWRALADVEHVVVHAGAAPALPADASITLHQQASSGIAAAFNEGLARARGEWVWFVNGGDAVHEDVDPAWLLRLLDRTAAEVVTGALHFDGEVRARAVPGPARQWPLLACWLMHPATLVRTERLRAVGGFREEWRVAMDYDLWFRLLHRDTPVDVLSVPLARFNRGGVSERADSVPRARREEARVVLRRAGALLGAVAWLAGRVLVRLARALAGRGGPSGSGDRGSR